MRLSAVNKSTEGGCRLSSPCGWALGTLITWGGGGGGGGGGGRMASEAGVLVAIVGGHWVACLGWSQKVGAIVGGCWGAG